MIAYRQRYNLFSGKRVFIWEVTTKCHILLPVFQLKISIFILYYFIIYNYFIFLLLISEETELLHDTIETCLLSACSSIYRFLSVNQESTVLQGREWWISIFFLLCGLFSFIVSTVEILLCVLCVNKVSNLQTQNPLKKWVIYLERCLYVIVNLTFLDEFVMEFLRH